MDLKDYWRLLRVRWRIFVGLTLLGLMLGILATAMMPKTYSSRAEVFVAPRAGTSGTDLLQGSNFILNRVKSYVELIDSELVLEPVIEGLGLDMTSRELAQKVSAEVIADTSVVAVTVTDTSPTEAARISNAVTEEFVRVAPTLEVGSGLKDEPDVVRVTTVQSAEVPSDPVSPSAKLNIALGLMAGLAAGLAGAVLREFFDRRVKGVAQLTQVTSAPIIGRVPSIKGSSRGEVAQIHSEAIREIRTNLQFVEGAKDVRSFVITSSRPGEGKSSLALSLAEALARAGRRVCLVEADLRRPVLGKRLNLESSVGLTTVLIGAADRFDVIQRWGEHDLDVIVAGQIPPNPSELLSGSEMAPFLRGLEALYDVVLVDSPPLLPVTDGAILANLCGGAIVVVEAGRNAVKRGELRESLEKLHAVGAPVLGIVLNKMSTKGVDSVATMRYDYVSGEERLPI